MTNRFESYANTKTGRELVAAIDIPELVPEFIALCKIGKPAVQGIVPEVEPIFKTLDSKADRDAASQFCGWQVGVIMRRLGFRKVRDRGRVTGAPFKTGAVWEARTPNVQVVKSMPEGCPRRIEIKVEKDEAGNVYGNWIAVSSATNPVRRIHTIVESPSPIRSALQHARQYAEKWGYEVIWIKDPERLYDIETA